MIFHRNFCRLYRSSPNSSSDFLHLRFIFTTVASHSHSHLWTLHSLGRCYTFNYLLTNGNLFSPSIISIIAVINYNKTHFWENRRRVFHKIKSFLSSTCIPDQYSSFLCDGVSPLWVEATRWTLQMNYCKE